ncbi:hypothetical protein [Tsuneonella mangrovi]|uniref:hypothetical protein n=1 Tax=Tsuneonella mangrovi TaxID=1982042 RepID=UPI000BA29B96|nr:hypothetical protein [Tsuneonella mangrovi]
MTKLAMPVATLALALSACSGGAADADRSSNSSPQAAQTPSPDAHELANHQAEAMTAQVEKQTDAMATPNPSASENPGK